MANSNQTRSKGRICGPRVWASPPLAPPRRSRRFTGWRRSLFLALRLSGLRFAFGFGGVGVHAGRWRAIHQFPTGQSLENEVRVLNDLNVAVVFLDHFDGCAHLPCERQRVGAEHQPEGRVRVTQGCCVPALARSAQEQVGFFFAQNIQQQALIKRAVSVSYTHLTLPTIYSV